jgi:hypothetical protein
MNIKNYRTSKYVVNSTMNQSINFFIEKLFDFWGFYESVIEHNLLELEAPSVGKWIATYRSNMSPSSLRVKGQGNLIPQSTKKPWRRTWHFHSMHRKPPGQRCSVTSKRTEIKFCIFLVISVILTYQWSLWLESQNRLLKWTTGKPTYFLSVTLKYTE